METGEERGESTLVYVNWYVLVHETNRTAETTYATAYYGDGVVSLPLVITGHIYDVPST